MCSARWGNGSTGRTTYRRGLNWSLSNRWKTIGIAAALSIVGLALFVLLPKELTPEVDESGFVAASETPTSASVQYTDEKQRQLEQIVMSVPEVQGCSPPSDCSVP